MGICCGASGQHIPEYCYRRCTAPPEWEHAKSGYGQGTDLRSDLGRVKSCGSTSIREADSTEPSALRTPIAHWTLLTWSQQTSPVPRSPRPTCIRYPGLPPIFLEVKYKKMETNIFIPYCQFILINLFGAHGDIMGRSTPFLCACFQKIV